MRRLPVILLAAILGLCLPARAQTIKNASYSIVAHIKDDGTIQDASYRITGHIKADGTVQDASYRTLVHASGIPRPWAAYYFFFSR